MVVALPVYGIIPLVGAGADTGGILQPQPQGEVTVVGLQRIPDPGDPAGTVRPGAQDADIPADVEHIALHALRLQRPGRHLGGVALADSAYVDGRLRVGDPRGPPLFIQLQKLDAAVSGRLLQDLRLRQSGLRRIGGGLLPAIMPQMQHRAQHHVHLSPGQLVKLAAVEQKLHQFRGDLQRFSPGVSVERAQVVLPGIFMVDVKELMVFFQNMRNFGRTVRKLFCRISCVAIDKRDGIKESEIGLSHRLTAFLRTAPAAAESGCEAQGAAEGDDPLNTFQVGILRRKDLTWRCRQP